jgi:XapX domain-containing protein
VKDMFISFAVGIFVGFLYGVIKVKSPAPPTIALLGLFGMVLGEQVGGWIHTRKIDVAHTALTCVTGKHWNPPGTMSEQVSAAHRAE